MAARSTLDEDLRILVLTPEDSNRYNAFLRSGSEQHPDTLRFSPTDVIAAPFVSFVSGEGRTLVALSSADEWLGVGSIERERGREKRRHIAWILRMYVAKPGRGIGRLLLRELKHSATAMAGITKLNLTVAAHNSAAVELYRSEGFVEFSRETDAFRVENRSVTELSMSCSVER
jgi:ribosomal protein S18 acetylase RimI-like enzyme